MARRLTFVLLASVFLPEAEAVSSNQTLRSKSAAKAGVAGYTQNSLCRENYCINPIFPGLNDLPRLEALTWQCATQKTVKSHMNFCKEAVLYDPALPSPTAAKTVAELVKAQDDAAMTMYFYHLSGMGYESWDNRAPTESDSDCVRSVWKMVCFTYFPRSNAGCQDGQVSLYQRPCQSSCHNYIKHCGVECCDESVQCSFTSTKTGADGKVSILQSGYVNTDGPSATCTGGARRSISAPVLLLLGIFGFHLAAGTSSRSYHSKADAAGQNSRKWRWLPLAVLLAACTFLLQGCDAGIERHGVGNWRSKPNYLNQFKYLPSGKTAHEAVLNSCAAQVPATEQCSGRGYCKAFDTNALVDPQIGALAFCICEEEWADPECSTRRKSQMTAWFFSIFLGPFGADYFYLGYPLWGTGKLLTLGGFGFWWLIDVVRISAGPVYAYNFRTANDLPHWAAILALVFACLAVGFFAAIESYLIHRKNKRANLAKLQHSEERGSCKGPWAAGMSGYGATFADQQMNRFAGRMPASQQMNDFTRAAY